MRRNGFTLVELIVSVGILGIMVTISGWVFSLTLDSTGQANALMEVTHACKSIERQMREELANVPSDSVMVIHPHIVNAYWTKDEKEADFDGAPYADVQSDEFDEDHVEYAVDQYDASNNAWLFLHLHQMPRADSLMFFTATPARSQATGTQSGMQMVTYSHADLGKWDDTTGAFNSNALFDANPCYIEQQNGATRSQRASNAAVFPTPASQWHLARRAVVISNQIDSNACEDPSDSDLLEGIKDILAPGGTGSSNETIPGFLYSRDVAGRIFSPDPAFCSQPIGTLNTWDDAYNDSDGSEYRRLRWWNRPKLDMQPTASQADRIGAYMLSNCASFKVEWTFDNSAFAHLKNTPWFDTAVRVSDPSNTYPALCPGILIPISMAFNGLDILNLDYNKLLERQSALSSISGDLHKRVFSMADANFASLDAKEDGVAIFYPKTQEHASAPVLKDSYFPTALRITMEVYDSSGRLDKPIKHTMVLPVGNR